MKLESLIDTSKDNPLPPMTKEQTEVYLMLALPEMRNQAKEPAIDVDADQTPFVLKIIESRLRWAGIADKVSFGAKVFVAGLCDRPAKAVMWCYTFAHMLQLGAEKVNMKVLTNHFPMGFPTEEVQEACWDAQKGHVHGVKADNLMDKEEWWQ
jgi:hypothetical protein